jgi:serine/threonine protein kinase
MPCFFLLIFVVLWCAVPCPDCSPTSSAAAHNSIGYLRLCDFGSGVDPDSLTTLYPPHTGPTQSEETLEYAAPEVLFSSAEVKEPYAAAYPQAYDVWSVGVVWLELILGSNDVFKVRAR